MALVMKETESKRKLVPKHNEKDQDLQIALGGEQEYRYDDGGGNGQNDRHLLHKAV